MNKELVAGELFAIAAEVEGFEPYATPYTGEDSFLLDAGRSAEDRAVFIVRVEDFHDPED